MTNEQENERRIQEACRRLVDREIGHCVSALVAQLANSTGQVDPRAAGGDLTTLVEQAFELSTAIPDYIEAAEEDGARFFEDEDGDWQWRKGDDNDGSCLIDSTKEQAAQDYCDSNRIDPHEREVYEHWLVSNWMADKLEAHGEKVDRDFAGLTIWARTCTGQAILLDQVIRDIVKELGWDKPEQTHA